MAVPGAEELFLMVNPKSGGNKGEIFLKAPQPFPVEVSPGRKVNLRIFSMLDGSPGNKPGFQALKQTVARQKPTRLVVGGGDGTVMWADGECEKHGIDTTKDVIMGIVPLGTGNDFARSYGWGGKNPTNLEKDNWAKLRDMTANWANAIPTYHDVWNVKINVNPSTGVVYKVGGDREEVSTGKKILEGPLVNYFSVGMESRAGIFFDKKRTKSQLANLGVYALAGAKTMFSCGQWDHIDSIIQGMWEGTSKSGQLIFNQCREDQFPDLVGHPASLLFLNINSYAGGNAEFWDVNRPSGREPASPAAKIDVAQDPGDGRLEAVTIPRLSSIAMEKIYNDSLRVWSGGPYYLRFNDDTDDTPDDFEAWCNIDGEYYHLEDPNDCTITLKKKIRTLRAPESCFIGVCPDDGEESESDEDV
mmetsp:Transcript_44892/g.106530  ORF Transcript_44892/g.106530 Transcript_44892/m.106530 type:complete len:417 (+) Transcript_44892:85-1335(+)|eukprot:CAMPEP_0178418598 /NCGR_PEP_ID=MMETSP0689_2-20121128/25173_1 /TAXON_ID=160604 /ORGANISM="Amphidinium massartii, Strain CS-259" /LENGTH=416 /DNA_ID=CAMNT_0020040001 /DNA_START=44 /DNA_END=1294 /DNA_ORIENTATION=+